MTLTDTNNPYRFKTLLFKNNGNSVLTIPTLAPGNKVTIYTDNFDGGSVNGQQMFNTNNAPRCLQINITSNQAIKLNGNADMYVQLIAPTAYVELLGNFDFYGSIEAWRFAVTGNGTFNYDEGIGSPGTPVVTDMTFAIKKASQRYR